MLMDEMVFQKNLILLTALYLLIFCKSHFKPYQNFYDSIGF